MEFVHKLLTTPLCCLIGSALSQHHSLDPTDPLDELHDNFLVHLPWSTQPQQDHQQRLIHGSEAETVVGPDEPRQEEELQLCERPENEISENLNTETKYLHSREMQPSRDKTSDQNRNEFRYNTTLHMDHEITEQRSDDQSPTLTEEGEQPEYPTLKELPWTDIKLASKAGHIPPLCSWCDRLEDQPSDKCDNHDKASVKCFMFGNIFFSKKTKHSCTQCTHGSFGLRKRAARRTKTARLRKFFCKLTGRKNEGPNSFRMGTSVYGRLAKLDSCR